MDSQPSSIGLNLESDSNGDGEIQTPNCATRKTQDIQQNNIQGAIRRASAQLLQIRDSNGAILILTGAGMSVASGVPVFRHSDGSMSQDFLSFLNNFNHARKRHGLPTADDWFEFSVPEMFRSETAKEAWQYWRWRILRAQVTPGQDYEALGRLIQHVFPDSEKVFVVTSNCDQLHVKSGMVKEDKIQEIHGSLGTLQCSGPCCDALYPVNESFIKRLQSDQSWVPMCPKCQEECLRPNVMIFGDHSLVFDKLDEQSSNYNAFLSEQQKDNNNYIVLEIGAGTVVPSIRRMAEELGVEGQGGLIRINPSTEECAGCRVQKAKYAPIVAKSLEAIDALCDALKD